MESSLKRIKKHLIKLSEFNTDSGEGLSRFTFTKEEEAARQYLKNELKKIGVEAYEDQAGNLFGRIAGDNPDAPAIMIGSHYDSVKNGGHFDGPAGVIMGLEIMTLLQEEGFKPQYPIEFVALIEEEGGRFGSGLYGSRAMVGAISYQDLLNYKDKAGISMAEELKNHGFDPKKIKDAARDPESIKAFIELHIEQGPVLENEAKDVGLVDFIVGINEFKVKLKGRPDHAGTTPMDMRKDALLSAARVVQEVEKAALKAANGTVATVGEMEVKPGAANIVPGEVEFSVDIRSKSAELVEQVKNDIRSILAEEEKNAAVEWEINELLSVDPIPLSEEILVLFEESARENNFSYKKMISGAGHDAMVMAGMTDVGLVFVPSKGGRSHCPEEWTDYEDLQKGIEVIYQAVKKLGGQDG
ncbi:Zn-dependent hydrolase [Halanaerobium hydrogeniformans]|uniref:Amidase, hydantoinase/carbamoylase family n=1 Tax=Halanaerobium hydrogeniformans TaxID=656519 RepID=E4RPA9_HALHG|nr:Zn-dependent hydrolase [Halanaerobium hydrogeniformans]ADQ13794.1 amidase, hydantoinase/carbamoylase family [Halanaerobium hydrogeniformans]